MSLVGRPGREAIPEPEAGPTWEVLQTVQRSGDPFLGNEYPSLWGQSSPGEQRYFNFVAQPTKGEKGKFDSVMVHAVEVTDSVLARRKTEELAKQLLHTHRTKDEFLAVLGHELRNPLAPILTALHLMRLRASDTSTERERAVIERQVAHLSRLVDDLLDVSRATMGKIDLRRERLDVATAVARAVEIARPLIDARKHQIAVSVPVGALYVDGDVVRLAQVIANLLQNAAKYTDPGGHIEVDARREDDQVAIRVRDDGRGIRPDRLASMFELFVQGDQPSDRSEGGLGIGLTIVRSLVQLHGGTVQARSEGPGRGSEFVVRLPWQPEDADANVAEQAIDAAARTQPSRVLIVDDDVEEAEALSQTLRSAGLEVRQVHDGTSAVVAAAQFPPDVVLLDLGLSGMGAIEVARRLRGEADRSGVRIVALTTLSQPAERTRIAAVGIEKYLMKPVDPAALLEVIGAAGGAASARNP